MSWASEQLNPAEYVIHHEDIRRVGVGLTTPSGTSRVVRAVDGVTLTGDPLELALYLSGRRGRAQVAVTGNPDAGAASGGWVAAS